MWIGPICNEGSKESIETVCKSERKVGLVPLHCVEQRSHSSSLPHGMQVSTCSFHSIVRNPSIDPVYNAARKVNNGQVYSQVCKYPNEKKSLFRIPSHIYRKCNYQILLTKDISWFESSQKNNKK